MNEFSMDRKYSIFVYSHVKLHGCLEECLVHIQNGCLVQVYEWIQHTVFKYHILNIHWEEGNIEYAKSK